MRVSTREIEACGFWDPHKRTWNGLKYSDGFPLWLYGKGNCNWICQYKWGDIRFLQIIQLPVYIPCIDERHSSYATANGGDHVVHMLENSVISLRTLLANLDFDMKVNGSFCVLNFIWLGSWWLEVYRITTKHMVRLRAYVNNLSYHVIAIGKWQFHTLSGRRFSDDIFKCIFFNEEFQFRLKCHWNLFIGSSNIPALVQTMGRRRPGDKPLSEPIMVSLVTHTWSLGLNELKGVYHVSIKPYRIVFEFKFEFQFKQSANSNPNSHETRHTCN